MKKTGFNRRSFLKASAISGLGLAGAGTALANPGGENGADFVYEVSRTEAEWREMLETEEYNILRKRSTELPKTNPLWNNTAEGVYCCRGCELSIYDSVWKTELDKGWAFFKQSRQDAVLMGIDGSPPDGMDPNGFGALIEARCRRCGSHLGHILSVEGEALHCINGTSLQFRPAVI